MHWFKKIILLVLLALQSQATPDGILFSDTFDSSESTQWSTGRGKGTLQVIHDLTLGSAALAATPMQNYFQLVSEFTPLHLMPGDEAELHFTLRLVDSPPDNWGGFRFGLYDPKGNTGYFAVTGTGKERNFDLFAARNADHFFQTGKTNRLQNSKTGLGGGLKQGPVYHFSMRLTQRTGTGSVELTLSEGEKTTVVFHRTQHPLPSDFGRIVIGTGETSMPFVLDNVRVQTRRATAEKQESLRDARNRKIETITPTTERLDELRALLQSNHSPGVRMGLGEPIHNRDVWNQLARTEAASESIQEATALLEKPWQARDKTLFETQIKTDRSKVADFYRIRHDRLDTLTLAECLENQGRFLPALNAMLTALATEGTWVSSARSKPSFWEASPQSVDLISSMLAADISTSLYWLHTRLDPSTVDRVDLALRRNILAPMRAVIEEGFKANYLEWYVHPNNWNAVCLYGMLSAAMAIPMDADELAFYLGIAEQSIHYFLVAYEDDGFYPEGFDYWGYGFSRFLVVHELLRRATNGEVDLLALPKTRIAGSYPLLTNVAGNYMAGYSDDNPGADLNESALAFFLRRCGEEYDTTKLGSEAFKRGRYLYIPALFVHPLNPPDPIRHPLMIQPDPLRQVMESGQLYVFRPGESEAAFGAYIKFGHNGTPHNHNDIGTYGIAFPDDSAPVFDLGKMVYTDQTFGGGRYDLDVHTSYAHSVPLVDQNQQGFGKQFHAQIIEENFTEATDRVTADITEAYACPNLLRLLRSVEYSRTGTGSFTVTDKATFNSPAMFETAVTTFGTVEIIGGNQLRLSENTQAIDLLIDTGGQPFEIKETLIPQKLACGKQGRRIAIAISHPVEKIRISMTFTPSLELKPSGD